MEARGNFLTINNASVLRGNKKILNNISLQIDQHEHVVILGPNGSGKSTLLKLIAGDIRPLYHKKQPLLLFGSESWTLFELRKKIGFVSNELQSLYQREITGREVILSGFFGSIGLFDKCTKEQLQRATAIGRFLEITHLFDRSIESMSSGEARRFLIARALVHDPKILVFDEPTNSLDIKAQSLVLETMRKLARHKYTK
jgi:iron complex transport system ATP-binding protein